MKEVSPKTPLQELWQWPKPAFSRSKCRFRRYLKLLRKRLGKPAVQNSSTDITFVKAHWYKSASQPGDAVRIDLLVVGAGPAGSCAAYAAAEAGLSVVLIDAKARLGHPPHCGEFIPSRLAQEITLESALIHQKVDFMETRVIRFSDLPEEAPTLLESRVIPSPGLLINRPEFDASLARRAAKAGAVVLCSTRLIARQSDLWRVNSTHGPLDFRPTYVIAADGAASKTLSLLGDESGPFLVGRQMEIPLREPLNSTVVFLERSFTGGYAWLFPKNTTANLGIGMAAGAGEAKEQLDRLHTALLTEGLAAPGVLSRTGGLIGVSGLRARLVIGNTLLVGDAAGLTHPISGAGIASAVVSGSLAGRAVAQAVTSGDNTAIAEYENEIRGRYAGVLNHALAKRRLISGAGASKDFVELCRRTWIGFKEYAKRIR